MENHQFIHIANQIINSVGVRSSDCYLMQLNMLYGAIDELNLWSQNILEEVIEIERERYKKQGLAIENKITNAVMLVFEYSSIAFALANRSLTENKTFEIAKPLKEILSQLVIVSLSDEERKKYKSVISETELDFVFAAGNHNVSSFRMAPILRNSKVSDGERQ